MDQRSREEEYEKEIENMSKNMQNRKLQIEQIEEVAFLGFNLQKGQNF